LKAVVKITTPLN